MYVDALRKACPGIEQVWLTGPRVDDDEARGADWEFLAFGNREVLDEVRADARWQRSDVRLYVVVDGDRFEAAWGAPDSGRLSGLGWRVDDVQSASYALARDGAAGPERRSAVRVR